MGGVVLDQAEATLRGNTIRNTKTTPDGFFGDAIFVNGSSRATIEDNTLSDNAGAGTAFGGAVQVTILNNTIAANGWGIIVGFDEVDNESLQAKIFQNNDQCGILVDANERNISVIGVENVISANGFDLCDDDANLPEGFSRST